MIKILFVCFALIFNEDCRFLVRPVELIHGMCLSLRIHSNNNILAFTPGDNIRYSHLLISPLKQKVRNPGGLRTKNAELRLLPHKLPITSTRNAKAEGTFFTEVKKYPLVDLTLWNLCGRYMIAEKRLENNKEFSFRT